MATSLGKIFSTNEKIVSQYDNQTLGSTAEMVVIEFNQEKFNELPSQISKISLFIRKRRKVLIARAHLTYSLKIASVESKQA